MAKSNNVTVDLSVPSDFLSLSVALRPFVPIKANFKKIKKIRLIIIIIS